MGRMQLADPQALVAACLVSLPRIATVDQISGCSSCAPLSIAAFALANSQKKKKKKDLTLGNIVIVVMSTKQTTALRRIAVQCERHLATVQL